MEDKREKINQQIMIWIYEYELKSKDKFCSASEVSESIIELIEKETGREIK